MSSNKNDLEITRIAVGRTAFLGSLYDLREDSIPDKLSLGDTKIHKISDENPSKCEIIRNSQCDHQHLLSMIGISNDLWLNVTLNIVSSQGMLSLANYSLPTDTNIRILHYYDLCEKQTIPFELSAIKPNIPKILPEVKATHIVSGIKFGIEILLVLRLSPSDETRLDSLLGKLQERFIEKKFDLKTDELSLLHRMKLVKVFSNVPDLIRMNSLADVCTFMDLRGSHFRTNSRLEYNLRPINWFYSDYPSDKSKFVQLELSSHKIIKEHLIKLSTQFAESQQSNGSEMRPSVAQNSQIQISSEEYERIREIILNIRQGKLEQREAIQMLTDESKEPAKSDVDDNEDDTETSPNSELKYNDDKHSSYILSSIPTRKHSTSSTSETSLSNDSKTTSRKRVPSLTDHRISTKEDNKSLDLTSGEQLKNQSDIHTLTPPDELSHRESSERKKSEKDYSQLHSLPNPQPEVLPRNNNSQYSSSPNTIYINILLLGESGSGKSTFINALTTYLTYNNFREACSNKPILIIPVSFSLNVSGNSRQQILKFGNPDLNEDHDHQGQSVTQKCRSYVFHIGFRTKLRIIDTPGMGDARGHDQDDVNMQHILSFISNLPHLNAICIFLKPNETRLNVVVRSYFTRLLNFLGENARHNLIFCFTNTRSTSYTPGETRSLLTAMIDTLPIKNIPFDKTNTFCFDNESFRYLMAVQNGIKFDKYETEEYGKSWTTSAKESKRFLDYISKEVKCFPETEWRSIEHVQFKIKQIARPLLEALRTLQRNIILLQNNSNSPLIKLQFDIVSQPSSICYNCRRICRQVLNIWVLSHDLHTMSHKCDVCNCGQEKHIAVDYEVKYEVININQRQPAVNIMKANINHLNTAISQFAEFHASISNRSRLNDPILLGLEQIVTEENQICSEKGSQCLNSELQTLFNKRIDDYKERRKILNGIPSNLSDVYETVQYVSMMDDIKEQLRIIQHNENMHMKRHDKIIG